MMSHGSGDRAGPRAFVFAALTTARFVRPGADAIMPRMIRQMVDVPCFFINLKNRTDRRNFILSQIPTATRIEAVETDTLRYYNTSGDAVLATYFSHLKAIEAFARTNKRVGVIIEDDADFEFTPHITLPLSGIAMSAPLGWTTIQLHTIGAPEPEESCYRIAQTSKLVFRRTPLPPEGFSAAAYLISREGAMKFLAFAKSAPKHYPLISDWILWHFPGANSFSIYPSIVLAGTSVSSLHNYGRHVHTQVRTLIESRVALCTGLGLQADAQLCSQPFEDDHWAAMTAYPYATYDYSMWHSYKLDLYYACETGEDAKKKDVLRTARAAQVALTSHTHFQCMGQRITVGTRNEMVPFCSCAA